MNKENFCRRPHRLSSVDCESDRMARLVSRLKAAKISDLVVPSDLVQTSFFSTFAQAREAGLNVFREFRPWNYKKEDSMGSIWSGHHLLFESEHLSQVARLDLSPEISLCFNPTVRSFDKKKLMELVGDFENVFLDPLTYSSVRPFQCTVEEVASLRKQIHLMSKLRMERHPGRLINARLLHPASLPEAQLKEQWSTGPKDLCPRDSIISPCFNNAEFLSNVLRHLCQLDSDRHSFEILIVDDGSSISPSAAAQGVARLFPDVSVRYFYWEKPKVPQLFRAGQARTLGAFMARGENLVFVDSDVLVPSNFLQEVQASLSRADLVQFVRHHLAPEQSSQQTNYKDIDLQKTFIEEADYWGRFFEVDDWMKEIQHWKYVCSYGLALKASDFWLCGGFSSNYVSYGFEDTELGYRMAQFGKKFELNKTRVYHLTAPHQIYSKWERQLSIMDSAKVFYLNQFDDQLVTDFGLLMAEPFCFLSRMKARVWRKPVAEETAW